MSLTAIRHYFRSDRGYLRLLVRQKCRQWLRCQWVTAHGDSHRDVPPPLAYKLVLTDRCNLACKMCMNIENHAAPPVQRPPTDIDYDLVKRLLSEVADSRPSVILSGGEPMLYPRFSDLIRLLESAGISTNICTNGTLIEKHLAVLRDKRFIQLTVSLDGIREDNDRIRGHGVYDVVVSAIHKLRQQPGRRLYVGIQHTIRPENVASMVAFCEEMVALDVDWILLNPCWHLSPAQADEYGAFMRREYGVAARSQQGYVMDCAIDTDLFARQYAEIKAKRWPLQISCHYRQPAQDLRRTQSPAANTCQSSVCYKQWLRMDIMPDGKVVSCQQYPDLVLGDLHQQPWDVVWNGPSFRHFRHGIARRPLPVCENCAPRYLYDPHRLHL